MILDGYNVIHRLPSLQERLDRSLQEARAGLIRCCMDWLAYRKDAQMFYVVFDGSSDVLDAPNEGSERVRVVFTDSSETADERIIRIVRQRERADNCVVVSDDNYVRTGCRSGSCDIMSVEEFCATLNRKKSRTVKHVRHGTKTGLSPDQERRITDELRRVWE
jgi:predicted RNA-binding protein with PIN domain